MSYGTGLRFAACVSALASILLATACQDRFSVQELFSPEGRQTLSVSAPTASPHNLALISVDFEPPLRQDSPIPLSADRVALLVAVDNKGSSLERNVLVIAKLTGRDSADELLSQAQTLQVLAPGEVRVVRFADLPSVPLRGEYTLAVSVLPVSGESSLSDNQRTVLFRLVALQR